MPSLFSKLFTKKITLRTKTLIIVGTATLIVIAVYLAVVSLYVQRGYNDMEVQDAKKNVERAQEGISAELQSLSNKVGDWANWDDAYYFPLNRNNTFIKVNFEKPTFEQIDVNLILFASTSGTIIFAKSYDLENKTFQTTPKWWQTAFLQNSPLLQNDSEKDISGIVLVENKPMLISAKPILNSQGEGPVTGTLLFGRYIDARKINDFTNRQKNPIVIKSFNDIHLPPAALAAKSSLSKNNPIVIIPKDQLTLNGFALIYDIYGKPSVILEEDMPRHISQFGTASTRTLSYILFGFGLAAVLIAMWILEREVLRRIIRLQMEVHRVGQSGSLSSRVINFGTDELGDLAANINQMLEKLETISTEKAYKESQQESILENIGEGVIITDENKNIIYINPVGTELLGFTFDELKGKQFSKTIKAYDLKGILLSSEYLDDSNSDIAKYSDVKVLLEGKNKKIPVIINTAKITANGKYKGTVRILYNYSLELELQKQKDDFFSIASHELRTPLTVIAGATDNILEGYGKSQLSDLDKQQLHDVMSSAERLISIVNSFLNVSRIEQGRIQMDIKPVNIYDLENKILKEMEPIFTKKEIKYSINDDTQTAMVMADETKLREIFLNLIGNSVKFTKKGGSISVTNTFKDGMAEIQVSDNGLGISPEKQHLLFHRFQQVMDTTLSREAGGTGLGLYISREFARLMGGNMWLVKSEPDKGTTFAFNLPLEK